MRASLLVAASAMALPSLSAPAMAQVYATYGAHNPPEASPCQVENCVYPRPPGAPSDPLWPEYWQSDWTMYRVYEGYADNPPPYADQPPAGTEYQTSYGATYYDSTWRSGSGEGAMMESYDDYCLPIFPLENAYSCKFISLGNTAYFVAGDGRPGWVPEVCLFSPMNHPPRRDFISHLPWSKGDSERLSQQAGGVAAQAYSMWVSAVNGYVMQEGAAPDQTDHGGILFGYGFMADADGQMQPQSFYFSGYPLAPANAPIVSQNYTDFAATQPPPDTWSQVAGLDPDTLPKCQLFDPPAEPQTTAALGAAQRAPTWGDIGRWNPE